MLAYHCTYKSNASALNIRELLRALWAFIITFASQGKTYFMTQTKSISRALALVYLWLCTLPVVGQTPVSPEGRKAFEERMRAQSGRIESIQSAFTQVKYIEVLRERVVSRGTFYYRRSNMMRMDYTSPVHYQMIVNGDKIKTTSDGRSTTTKLGGNKMMMQMQSTITACLAGDFSQLSRQFDWELSETPRHYLLTCQPRQAQVRAYLVQIVMTVEKDDLSLSRLKLMETATNYTEYTFVSQQLNTLRDASLFEIR